MGKSVLGLLIGLVVLATAMPLLADDVRERIEERMAEAGLEAELRYLEESPVPGLYMAMIQGQVLYFSEDGRYLIQGEMLDLEERAPVAEGMRRSMRAERLADYDKDSLLIYPAEGETEHVVTVFTDIECPYCQRMHRQIDDYTAQGIEIRYAQFPRAGVGSSSYHKSVAVWCAEDRKEAMNRAKAGDSMGREDCENPVSEQLDLARELGVDATPTMISETGVVQRGLVDARQLRAMLDDAAQAD